jgi:hypothetical protein
MAEYLESKHGIGLDENDPEAAALRNARTPQEWIGIYDQALEAKRRASTPLRRHEFPAWGLDKQPTWRPSIGASWQPSRAETWKRFSNSN